MTDRVHSLTVALNKDVRVDDVEGLINAILQFRGVIKVEGNISDSGLWVAESRIKHDLTMKLYDALK